MSWLMIHWLPKISLRKRTIFPYHVANCEGAHLNSLPPDWKEHKSAEGLPGVKPKLKSWQLSVASHHRCCKRCFHCCLWYAFELTLFQKRHLRPRYARKLTPHFFSSVVKLTEHIFNIFFRLHMKLHYIIPEKHKLQKHAVSSNFLLLKKKLNFLIYFTATICVAHTVLQSHVTNKGNTNVALLNGKLLQEH